MTITECKYQHLDDGYSLINCEFNVGNSRTIRCVKTEELKIDSSVFIGLKFSKGIDLDTTKQPIIKKKLNLVNLFDDEVEEEIKEDIQLGLF